MNLTILSLAKGKTLGQTGLFILDMATDLGEGNL